MNSCSFYHVNIKHPSSVTHLSYLIYGWFFKKGTFSCLCDTVKGCLNTMIHNTRSVRKVLGLSLYLRTIVFERPLLGMNVNSKASRTYGLLADICRTYSSCAACFCLQSYLWVRRILWLLKMTGKQDQRFYIKFCFQLGKTSSETIQMMQKAFGNECMSKTRRNGWYNRFKGGRTSLDSDFRSGRPSTTKTLDNIERVRLAIQGDRRLTVRELENDLEIPKTTVWEILNKILGMTRVCAVTGFFTTKTRQRIHRILCSSFWVNTVSHCFTVRPLPCILGG